MHSFHKNQINFLKYSLRLNTLITTCPLFEGTNRIKLPKHTKSMLSELESSTQLEQYRRSTLNQFSNVFASLQPLSKCILLFFMTSFSVFQVEVSGILF
jgi:hypothetical protein